MSLKDYTVTQIRELPHQVSITKAKMQANQKAWRESLLRHSKKDTDLGRLARLLLDLGNEK